MEQEEIASFLEHHGVKGMHWGVRNRNANKNKVVSLRKADKSLAKLAGNKQMSIKIWNHAAQLTNKNDVARINNKPEYKNHKFSDWHNPDAITKKYLAEHDAAMTANLQKGIDKFIGPSPSGTYKVEIQPDRSTKLVKIGPNVGKSIGLTVKHSDSPMMFVVSTDANGHILSFDPEEDGLMQSEDLTEAFLAHHGVKGQKWGVRKARRNPGTKGPVLPSGRRARKFDTNNLSNKELKKVIDRMEMERKYTELNAKTKSEGRILTKQILKTTATGVITAAAAAAAKHMVDQMLKKQAKK